ncbi:MAG: hypothetical protein M1833_004106 [Piccolia ochrophora]|nr:MAG: hypothetical protein M1833_004106 [Piccolia ochrophora]
MPPSPPPGPLYFSSYHVTAQAFHRTALSFAFVNIRPLLPGHVLVSPIRSTPRLSHLTPAEVADLFHTVQRVARMVERVFGAQGLNVAVQDGAAAGQSVKHVHAHIIPRKGDDGWGDRVYEDVDQWEKDEGKRVGVAHPPTGAEGKGEPETEMGFPKIDDASRLDRTEDEMNAEAAWLREEMEKDDEAVNAQ